MTDFGQDTELGSRFSKGTIYSGIGHVGVILWVLIGDWLMPHSEPEEIASMAVSTMSSAEFDAMVSQIPAQPPSDAPEQETAAEPDAVPTPPEVEPSVDTEPAPEPEPAPQVETPPEAEAPPPEPTPDPVPSDPVPDPAPDDVVMAPEEQPIPNMSSSMRPKPKPAPVVAPDPVSVPEDSVTAETPTEATTDQPTETPPEVIEEPQAEAVPEETGDVIETEATEAQDESLGMAASPRPKAKPNRPRVTETPAETPTETATPSDNATDDAVAAALAEAEAEARAEEQRAEAERAAAAAAAEAASSNAPSNSGPPMSAGEIGDVRASIGGKWSLGAVSSDTLRTTIVVRVSFDPTGKPTDIKLIESDGPSQAATDTAFSAARSAIIRAAREGGIPFPPDKYETWKVVDFVFDPNGMRFR